MVVFTLALGIGSAAAIYSVVWWHLFRKVPAPPGVYMIGTQSRDGSGNVFVPSAVVAAYTAPNAAIERCAVSMGRSFNVVVGKSPATPGVVAVTDGFFQILGITPELGRLFIPGEYVEGRDAEIVVTHEFWKRHLGGRSDALGSKIRVGDDLCEIIGVLKEDQRFSLYSSADVYQPFTYRYDPKEPMAIWPTVYAQLRTGVTPKQAEDVLGAIRPDVPEPIAAYLRQLKPTLVSVADAEKLFRSDAYRTLVGAVGFLYLIACLNATNLMLGQLLSRKREFSIRLALGSSLMGIGRLVAMEALILSFSGALVGALLANWLTPLFFLLDGRHHSNDSYFSWNLSTGVVAVLGGLAVVTALATGLSAVAFVARKRLTASGSEGESRNLRRLRSGFVVLQSAMAIVLLVGTGLMIRTFQRMEHLRLGFDQTHRVRVQFKIPSDLKHPARGTPAVIVEHLRQAILQIPGAEEAALSSGGLLAGYNSFGGTFKGPDGSEMKVGQVYASQDFGGAAGLRLLAGHWFGQEATLDVVINESLARKRFAGIDPVGQYLAPYGSDTTFKGFQVVGVVADVREKVREAPMPTVYIPLEAENSWAASSLVVKFHQEPDSFLLSKIREATYASNPDIVVYDVGVLDKALDQATDAEHLTLDVFRVLSLIALVLTIIGLYSTVSYTVDRRMGEFGIRMAVGATAANVMALVVRQAVLLTAAGIVIGTGGALALTRFIRSLLFEAPALDETVIAVAAVVLLISGVFACVPPARRASRPDLLSLLKRLD